MNEEEGRWAFDHAHLMRKRFSAGDLYYLLGWLDEGLSDRIFARRDELIAAVSSAPCGGGVTTVYAPTRCTAP